MKIFISADIEGVCGVTSWASTEPGGKGYEEACRQMSLETAAAARAAINAGYEVVVKDGHGDAMNIDPCLLPKGTQLIRGWMCTPYSMLGGFDESFDGVMYIGYHSGAWTNTSPLKHTGEDYLFNWLKINDKLASEFTINSQVADQLGVPSLFISGDKGICEAAGLEYPGIITAPVKEGMGNGTLNMHPDDAIELIEKQVALALSKPLPKARPLEDSYTMTVNFKEHQKATGFSWYPGAKKLDEYTVSVSGKTPLEVATARFFIPE